jgi:outer membrane protein OmpA-like peptidoglycan-associated protein
VQTREPQRHPLLTLIVLVAVVVGSQGCASRLPGPPLCAAIGATLGGAAGAVIAADQNSGNDTYAAVGYGALGAVVLGSASYFVCRALAKSTDERMVEEFARLGLEARITERGVVVYLPDVLFAFDSAQVDTSGAVKIGAVADVILRLGGDRPIAVEGHSDSFGSDDYNQELSERRAASAEAILIGQGIDGERTTTLGFGEKYPIAPNQMPDGSDNPEGRAQNRRVEIVIEKK